MLYAFRLKEYRDKALNGGPPVLYLNAGDTYTGTPWFKLYKDKIVAEFLNLLKPDAIVSAHTQQHEHSSASDSALNDRSHTVTWQSRVRQQRRRPGSVPRGRPFSRAHRQHGRHRRTKAGRRQSAEKIHHFQCERHSGRRDRVFDAGDQGTGSGQPGAVHRRGGRHQCGSRRTEATGSAYSDRSRPLRAGARSRNRRAVSRSRSGDWRAFAHVPVQRHAAGCRTAAGHIPSDGATGGRQRGSGGAGVRLHQVLGISASECEYDQQGGRI